MKEQLLKSLPSRVRELLGKEVETLSADEVAAKADSYFDKQGQLLERSHDINAVGSSSANRNFTQAFEEDDTSDEVNQVRRFPPKGGNNRGSRPESRQQASKGPARSASRPSKLIDGLCRFHRKFGDEAWSCSDGCKKQHLTKKPPVNSNGVRRQ